MGPQPRFVTPGLVFDGELITTDLVEINLAIRILLGSSYFDDWTNEETFVTHDPLGNPVDKRHPWNKVTLPKPQARDFADKYSWVVSPRMYDKRNDTYVASDTGGGPFARQWVTAKAGIVDIGYVKATGDSILMTLPKTGFMPEMDLEWKVPEKSNAIERDRARTYHQAFSALVGALQPRGGAEGGAGRPHEEREQGHRARQRRQRRLPRGGARGALAPHGHPRRQGGELPAVPADAVERQPARLLRDAGAVRGRRGEHADLRGERARQLQGGRHHAGGPLVRPVPAVRRAHVHRQGEGAEGGAHADGAVLSAEPEALVARVEELTAQLEQIGDPLARAAEELAGALMDLYGEGLERIFDAIAEEGSEALRERLTEDGVVASLMLIHDLYPVPLEERVQEALDSVRPYMESHGGNVELLGIEDGVARLRLEGSCNGCAASASTLELAVEQALQATAPDLEGIDVEGVVEPPAPASAASSSRWPAAARR